MLAKLIKYEFKATSRIFVPLFGALLFMALVTKLTLSLQMATPHAISLVLCIFMMIGAFILTLILSIQRYHKNLMTQEGTLMHTLPVSVSEQIASKLIVAIVWTLVCALVVYLSVAIMAFNGQEWSMFVQAIRDIELPTADKTLFIIEGIVLVLALLANSLLTIYASMSLSMLVNKHRTGIAFLFFIALNTVMMILFGFVTKWFINAEPAGVEGANNLFTPECIGTLHSFMGVTIGLVLLFAVGMFMTSRYMMKNRLNLQ